MISLCLWLTQGAWAVDKDIIFILDSSSSISSTRYNFNKELIKRFICGDAALDLPQSSFGVAVLQFARSNRTVIEYTVVQTVQDAADLCIAIDDITRDSGDTNPSFSFQAALSILANDALSQNRQLLFISDGHVDGPRGTQDLARLMRQMSPPVRICTIEVNASQHSISSTIRKFLTNVANSVWSEEYNPLEPTGQYARIKTFDHEELLCNDCLCDEDCNENGFLDIEDILSGLSNDCNQDAEPDDCFGDCDMNGIDDICELVDQTATDCNHNSILDICDLMNLTSLDCDLNQIPDECERDCDRDDITDFCEIRDGTQLDCDLNGIPDDCQIAQEDCNANGLIDACETMDGSSPDCNANGIPDKCDLASGTSQDCDENGIPGECEDDCNSNGIEDFCETGQDESLTSGWMSPFGSSLPVVHTFDTPLSPRGDATLTVKVIAELEGSRQSVNVYLNGLLFGELFTTIDALCTQQTTDQLTIDQATFQGFIASGQLDVRLDTGGFIDPANCNGNSSALINLDYEARLSNDSNENNVPDSCELRRGDFNLDGVVDVEDLLALLGAWGPCVVPTLCPQDTNLDGVIDVEDLLSVLGNWGTP